MSRKFDLENLIRESYTIIREYERIQLLSDRPEEKARSELNIKKQWENIERLLHQYELITNTIPDDIAEIANYLSYHFSKSILRILFLSADPTNASRLRVNEEFREIQEKLKLAQLRDQCKLELPQLSVRPTDITQALLDMQPQIVHFSGHGASTGALCFENQTGQIQFIQPEALAALFEQFSNQVKCVLLNACYSEIQAKAISEHIEYVIGMNKAIGDKAAISFAIGFYQALGAGRTIEDAFKLGCIQIELQDIPEHQTPALLKKSKIKDDEK